MGDLSSVSVLWGATVIIAIVHALAPDHWAPFVLLARSQRWSLTRLAGITFLCGLAHVGSSILVAATGLLLGFGLGSVEGVESRRGWVAGSLLIGFGLAYGIWGLKKLGRHPHQHAHGSSRTIWALFILFALGPCEPLIPLMFLGAAHGWTSVLVVTSLFATMTIAMMMLQSILGYAGVRLLATPRLDRYSDALAGFAIAITGGCVLLLGL